MDIEARLTKVEATLKRWKLYSVTLSMAFIVTVVVAMNPANQTHENISIVDPNGKSRIFLGIDNGLPTLSFTGFYGRQQIFLGLDHLGLPSLRFNNKYDDSFRKEKMFLGIYSDRLQEPTLVFYGPENKARLRAHGSYMGPASIAFYDETSERSYAIGEDGSYKNAQMRVRDDIQPVGSAPPAGVGLDPSNGVRYYAVKAGSGWTYHTSKDCPRLIDELREAGKDEPIDPYGSALKTAKLRNCPDCAAEYKDFGSP